MHSEVFTFPRAEGEHQRVHLVRFESWSQLDFLSPPPADSAFNCFHHIYRQFLVPSAPWTFGNLVMVQLPEDITLPEALSRKYASRIADPLTITAMALRRGIIVAGNKTIFLNRALKPLWDELTKRGCIRIVRGKRPTTTIIPVGRRAGFLTAADGDLLVNSSFFIMDPIDCATPYDHISTPFGLLVKNGIVESPPLFSREALLVHEDGRVTIEEPALHSLRIRIGDKVYVPGENADLYTRPEQKRSPRGKKALVIIGRRVEAVQKGAVIPASGFVLCPRETCSAAPGDAVSYEGMEDIRFGIQVGNSIIRDGVKTTRFLSRFYNIRGREPVPYPPSLYPLDYENARAARIALGADREGNPMVLWAEGAAKLGHMPGGDSCGASLAEMAEVCESLGMYNAVNLDGGGSAQILLHGERHLLISDRKTEDHTESERPVPMGLVIR